MQEKKSSKRLKVAEPSKGLRVSQTKLLPEVLESEIFEYLKGTSCEKATDYGKTCNRQFWFHEKDSTPTNHLDCSRYCVDFDSDAWIRQIFYRVPELIVFQDEKGNTFRRDLVNNERTVGIFFNFYWPNGDHRQVYYEIHKSHPTFEPRTETSLYIFGNNPFQSQSLDQELVISWLGWLTRHLQFGATIMIISQSDDSIPDSFDKIKSFAKTDRTDKTYPFGDYWPTTPVEYFGPTSWWKRGHDTEELQSYFGNIGLLSLGTKIFWAIFTFPSGFRKTSKQYQAICRNK